ncbi:MAG: hypothetical protein LAO30_00625 [Acidobacteriia bacterium]|nr:hypothetical protein [Terriglobia bacterium]
MPSNTRYNQPIPHMRARTSSGLRIGWLTSFLFATVFLPSSLCASSLGDTARQLAHKIAAASGPGAFALEVTNRSSLDDKSVREVRSALEAQLHVEGVHATKTEQAMGTIEVVLSESLRDYVWAGAIVIGSDENKIALVSLPRSLAGTPFAPALPIVLKTTLVFAQEQPILDIAVVEIPGGARLLVLDNSAVAIYRQAGANPAGRWELEASLPIPHTRAFPRDLRGRLLLRRDHLFDVYLPGTFCHSSAAAPLTITCNESDDPWPLTAEDSSARAFFATSRNFFTGALSPGIGKISNVPSFYSAAALPRSGYMLWALAAVDGSLHLVDGVADQAIRGGKWGSDLAAVRSSCGVGTQLLLSGSGDTERDGLRAFEIPDRDPVAVSSAVEFDGEIVALWPESSGNGAAAIVRRKDTGWYEAYRVSVSCGN